MYELNHEPSDVVDDGFNKQNVFAASSSRSFRFTKKIRGFESTVANDWSKTCSSEWTARGVTHTKNMTPLPYAGGPVIWDLNHCKVPILVMNKIAVDKGQKQFVPVTWARQDG